jgi:hypothetical protein
LGADRRGPLAAFIIVAIVAAILLVTSVRSQAAPWLTPERFSASVAGPALEPHLWGSVTGGLDDVVQAGAVLVRKASPDVQEPPGTTQPPASSHVVAGHRGRVTVPPRQQRSTRTRHQPVRKGTPSGPVDHDPVDAPADPVEPPAAAPTMPTTLPGRHDHGRHLGWLRHRGQAGPPVIASTEDGHGHGRGHGQGHGQGHGKGH